MAARSGMTSRVANTAARGATRDMTTQEMRAAESVQRTLAEKARRGRDTVKLQ